MTSPLLVELSDFAHQLADAAAEVQKRWFRAELDVESKLDESPVTIADRHAEMVMRELIQTRYPDHGVLGEEFGSTRTDAEFVWVLDPIDGTKSFICGRPQFGTLISLLRNGEPVLGVIDQSILRERWLGIEGEPTSFNGKPARVRACAGLKQAVLAASSRRMFKPGPERDAFDAIESACYLSQFNTDCYGYGLLALGMIDLVVERDLQPYDYLALLPVLSGAGAVVTDWQGAPVRLGSSGRIIAAGDARVHAAALARLAPLSEQD